MSVENVLTGKTRKCAVCVPPLSLHKGEIYSLHSSCLYIGYIFVVELKQPYLKHSCQTFDQI